MTFMAMKIRNILILSAIALTAVSLLIGQWTYSWMPPQAAAESQLVDKLFSFLITLGAFIFLGVTGTLIYSAIFHRAEKYDTSDVPLMIGARDMAFPRLNAVAFWMIPIAAILLMASFFVPGGPAQAGWWSYPPVSLQNPTGNLINGQVIWLLAVAISGVSSIMGAINFVTTVVKMRAPGMTFFRMPIFVWNVFSAQIIQLFGLPVLTAGAVMLLLDLTVGTSFFDPAKGGDPVLFQHFFWFYSHPAVYVIILPVFGVFSEIFPVFARKPLFGYKIVAISSLLIAGVSGIVWDTPFIRQWYSRLDATVFHAHNHVRFCPHWH